MAPVGSGGELAAGDERALKGEIIVKTFGRLLKVSRQRLLNQDLQIVLAAAASIGAGGSSLVGDLVWDALQDSGTFFSAGNTNIVGELSSATLLEALTLMRRRTDAEGKVRDFQPASLVVAPELEGTARALASGAVLADGTAYSLRVGVEPRITDETAWYLFGTTDMGAVVVGFLDGRQEPQVDFVERAPGSDLAGAWRCYIDVAVALGDPASVIRGGEETES